ncbi:O-acetylhomoserine aminocarboxypropyltransferase/cysteine synthase family protein [Yaniella flava]|uniref:O-acetylhomoserine aminocarboxypropyltransferase/cysteine synthase family protein n=1 Tax=Yaniella flava TaxID=287930 RepID=UPI003CD073A6
MTDQTTWGLSTRQIHAGMVEDSDFGATQLPIYQTTSFNFPDTATAAGRFGLSELGPIYTRLTNPTTDAVENKIAALEGGVGAVLLSSGQSATTLSVLNVAGAGDSVVVSTSLYGGTQNLFKHTLPRLGIETIFVQDPNDLDEWRNAIKSNTKAVFAEVLGNPKADVLDLPAVSEIAHDAGIPVIIDSTLTPPTVLRPIEHGADIIVHSATKYLSGHAAVIGGVIVDSGNFDWTANPEKFPWFNEPDESYHGVVFGTDFGPNGPLGANLSYILRIRTQLLRDMGNTASPFNAFLINLGLETLSLRMERHLENAQRVAEWLEAHPQVEKVQFAGLKSSPYYERAQQLLPDGTSGIVAFEIVGGKDAGQTFAEALTLHKLVANLGDVRSLVVHPATTTHAQLSESEQQTAGVTPGLVRLSVGLEDITDILDDLQSGFDAAAAV